MSNITITNNDPRHVALGPVDGVEANVVFGGEDTFVKGTLLGRKTTSADIYLGVVVGTGVKTINLTALAGQSMKPGAYVLTVGDVTAGVGPATLVDPDGISAAVTLAVSGAHDVPSLGVTFDITAGGTELDDADTVTFTVVAASGTELYAPFLATGVNGLQNPNGILLDDLVATGAGNVAARVVVAGKVNRALFVIDADGDDSNVTLAIIEQMRVNGLFPVSSTELGVYDNPQS